MRFIVVCLFLFVLFSCSGDEDHRQQQKNRVIAEAKPFIVPTDSIEPPQVIPFNEKVLKKTPAGIPSIVMANTNVSGVVESQEIVAGPPVVCIPGTGLFKNPELLIVESVMVSARQPEVVEVRNLAIKDRNSASIGYFSKLQGLKHDIVSCVFQDRTGNLWFGTGGGVTRYDGKSFTHYTKMEGLSNDHVKCILEDRSGNIWLGTDGGGVSKFDGRSFRNIPLSGSPLGNSVSCMLEDQMGVLWFGTLGGGVIRYNGEQFERYAMAQGLGSDSITSILEDRSGTIWLGTAGNGIVRFLNGGFEQYNARQGLPNAQVNCLCEGKDGSIWFGCERGGVGYFDGKLIHILKDDKGVASASVLDILEDRKGHLWFSTEGNGVTRFDGQTFFHMTTHEGLSSDIVYKVLEDREENLWFATKGGGVARYSDLLFQHYTTDEGLPSDKVSSICEDKNGALWFGTRGGGVTRYDGKQFARYSVDQGLGSNEIYCVYEDSSGNLWFGMQGGAARFDGKTFAHFTKEVGMSGHDVFNILEDRKGRVWFATRGGGACSFDGQSFTHYTKQNGLSHDVVICMSEDHRGNIWFGTQGGGVTQYDGIVFRHFKTKEGMPNDRVISMLEDNSGCMWFGTYGGGFARYDGYSITNYTTEEGLSNNIIFSMCEERFNSGGAVWLGSRFGLNQTFPGKLNMPSNAGNVDTTNEHGLIKNEPRLFNVFDYSDGFLGIGCNLNALYESTDGTLWIGADDRLTAFRTANLYRDSLAPNVQLTGLDLFNEGINWREIHAVKDTSITLGNGVEVGDFRIDSLSSWYGVPSGLSLAHNNNYLTFRFVGITMHRPERVKYRYKLEGLDADWSAPTFRNEAPYGNLPGGDYVFMVQAMNSEGIWSAPIEFAFVVRPPWWLTWWAYGIYAFIVVLIIKWREHSLKLRQKQLEINVDEATRVIREQKVEVEQQKEMVEVKNREILDSIEYAKRIQTAILPPPRLIKEFLKKSFILYLPKDIVAGDFYWMESLDDAVYFAACDCTGHGVPGAMVSVVCNNALSRSVNEFALRSPGEIFNQARELVIENFAKSDEEVKDGMDASLCALDTTNRKLLWAGANNPIWIFRASEQSMEEIKADKQPIGKAYNPKPFTTHEVTLKEGDIIYLFTDGYADQFGGENNKKFTRARFRELLLSMAHLPMDEQRNRLMAHHDQYRGSQEQVDDICVMGVRV